MLGTGLGAAALSGCGIQRERTAPNLPLLAPRSVDPRATAVYAELRRVRLAGTVASAVMSAASSATSTDAADLIAVATTLARIHQEQEAVLTGRLKELGEDPADTARLQEAVAAADLPAPVVPSPSSDGATVPSLSIAEAQGLADADLAFLDRLPTAEAPLLLALRVQRAVALPLVGGRAPSWGIPTVAGEAEAARLTGVFRSTEYAVEVAAARATDAVRTRLTGPLQWAASARLILVEQAGRSTFPEVPMGYTLPFPITDDSSALRLGQVVLAATADAVLSGTPAAAGSGPGLRTVLALASAAEGHAHDLGADLRAFPGLRRG